MIHADYSAKNLTYYEQGINNLTHETIKYIVKYNPDRFKDRYTDIPISTSEYSRFFNTLCLNTLILDKNRIPEKHWQMLLL